MERWQNRVAVVTGASAGIGAACCKYLIQNGMIVVGLARRKERVEKLGNDLKSEDEKKRLHAIKCDLRNEEDIRAAFTKIEQNFGPVAVLVNNAGVVAETELVKENNTEELRSVIETNVLGVAICTREAFRSMKKNNGDGHVILINSVAGHRVRYVSNGSTNIYPASKHAITAMTEVYRQEFQMHKTQVKVTSISPGLVDTEIFTENLRKRIVGFPSLKSEDIADAVIYVLQTPPHVQIHELTIKPMGEKF